MLIQQLPEYIRIGQLLKACYYRCLGTSVYARDAGDRLTCVQNGSDGASLLTENRPASIRQTRTD